ncbi:putative clathrin assembly protein At1g03050 [Telopea speciosissima]|uniref:putative clathrin assembly protein At1g03050 n=1 Tax=Telopea speciosissima TaxID=54955 RepID=UPI001CC40B49|nr:putative clathrin assembly protein At1g03050 [Telopea speciosissima]
MGPSKIRQALGAVKDKTSIGLAKVNGSSTSVSELEVAIVKATRHEENPADERHIREILSLTSYSRVYISACVNILSRRLNKTKNWTVALKTLILIHRLLLEGDPVYEQEIFFATRRGTRLLNMSDFRDCRSNNSSWDFSAFVRTLALYLDERLEYRMHGRRGRRSGIGYEDEEEGSWQPPAKTTPVREQKTDRIFTRAQHLQQILERFLACRPTGVAKHNRVVTVALYPVVKESFQIYFDIAEIMGILIDRFMELQVPDCLRVQQIFARLGKQFEELDSFYSWCKQVGICRSSEYPEIEKITAKKLEVMDEFIRDKSALAQMKRANQQSEQKNKNFFVQEDNKEPEPIVVEEEEDMSKIKALPPPEGFQQEEELKAKAHKEEEETKQEPNNTATLKEADLLNLYDDTVTTEEQGDKLALALFDGAAAPSSSSQAPPAWEAFNSEDSGDWETALVQSTSHLSNQQTSLAGGFDMLLIDGMYQQSAANAAAAAAQGAYGGTGSASSVVMSGKPAMLALPAPPVSANGMPAVGLNADPFAASLAVAPPAFVQMSDLEKKQKLLMEEQLLWQRYQSNGMQGQLGLTNLQQNPYPYG